MQRNIWDELFDEDQLADLNARLRAAQKVADRQAFGMPRQEGTDEFVKIMTDVRNRCDVLITRARGLTPPATRGHHTRGERRG